MRRGPLKPSRFNTRTTLADGTLLLFNFVSLAIVALEPRRAARAGEILDGALDRGAAPGYRRLAALLARNGFLVGADEDELGPLRAAFVEHRRDSTLLSLTVVPTLSCNFACTYCSQGPTHRGAGLRRGHDRAARGR